MRIALFSEVFIPKIDGVVNTTCRLLTYLQERGHPSILFAPSGGPKQYASTPVIGLSGFPLPMYPDLQIVPPIVNVSEQLDAFKPDIIHLINPFSLCLAGLWYGLQKNIPVTASYQTDLAGYANCWGVGYLSPIIWAYLRSIHNQADLNFAPSHFTKQELIANQFQRIKVWGRGVDGNLFSPSKFDDNMRCTLSQGEPHKKLLLYVGRLSTEKRIGWLRKILERFNDVRLAIIGDGPQRNELEHLFAHTPTYFGGFMRGEQLAKAYASSDIFVFPGANETFGNVVLEAMASGLAVIAPNSGGVTDYVTHLQTGLLFEAHSIESMLDQLQLLLNNPELTTSLRRNACSFAQTLTWDSIFDKLIQDYEQVIHDKRQKQASFS